MDGYVPGAPPVTMTWHAPTSGTAVQEAPAGAAAAGLGGGPRVIGEKLRQKRRLTEHEAAFLHSARARAVQDDHARGVVRRHPRLQARSHRQGVRHSQGPPGGRRGNHQRGVRSAARTRVCRTSSSTTRTIRTTSPTSAASSGARSASKRTRRCRTTSRQTMRRSRASIARSATIGMHLCRGNGPLGRWHTAGGYERIAETGLRRPGRRPVPAGVRQRARGRLRTAALRAARQAGRAGPGNDQVRRAGNCRHAAAADRRSLEVTCRSKSWRSARSAASPRRW